MLNVVGRKRESGTDPIEMSHDLIELRGRLEGRAGLFLLLFLTFLCSFYAGVRGSCLKLVLVLETSVQWCKIMICVGSLLLAVSVNYVHLNNEDKIWIWISQKVCKFIMGSIVKKVPESYRRVGQFDKTVANVISAWEVWTDAFCLRVQQGKGTYSEWQDAGNIKRRIKSSIRLWDR